MTATSAPPRAAPPFALGPVSLGGAYVALALAPLAAAWISAPEGGGFWPELATGLALAGYAMMLLQFVAIGRLRVVGGRVGIDVTMRLHVLAARALTVFVILHPFLYGVPRLASDPAAYLRRLWGMFTTPVFASGVVAWLLLLVLVVMAVHKSRLPLRYEAWRASHGLGALVVAAAGLHHAFAVGQLSPLPGVAAVWAALAALAAASLLYVYLLRPLALRRAPYRVAEVRALAAGRWLLALAPEGAPLSYRAGQFVWLKLRPHPFTLHENPFSLLSAPAAGDGGRLEFLIREAGDFTRSLGSVPVGVRAWVDGPHGAFTLRDGPAGQRVLLLAGGVGLAPILSILREAAAARDPRSFHLIYGNRTAEQAVLGGEIEALKASLDLAVDYVVSEPPPGWQGAVGEMNAATLAPLLAPARAVLADAQAYLCGPPPMVRAAEAALRAAGVAPRRMFSERFDYD